MRYYLKNVWLMYHDYVFYYRILMYINICIVETRYVNPFKNEVFLYMMIHPTYLLEIMKNDKRYCFKITWTWNFVQK